MTLSVQVTLLRGSLCANPNSLVAIIKDMQAVKVVKLLSDKILRFHLLQVVVYSGHKTVVVLVVVVVLTVIQ